MQFGREHVRHILVALLFSSYASLPAAAEEQVGVLFACLNLGEDEMRLACFDREVVAFRNAKSLGKIKIIEKAEIDKIERDSFGLPQSGLLSVLRRGSEGQNNEPAELNEVVLSISSFEINPLTKKAVLTLENGQTWEQSDSARIPRSLMRNAKEARISRAALGSFFVEVDGKTSFRAKRIK